MRVTPVSGALGAEIEGVDLAKPLSGDALEAIERALEEHLVVFFEGQRLSPAEQLRLTARFGEPMRVPYVAPMPDHPYVIAVLKEASERRISPFGSEWHSDFSFLARPPSLSFLHALETPAAGGDTLWANMCAAYETLSPGLRRWLGNLDVMHSGHIYGAARPPAGVATSRSIAISRGNAEADVEVSHPAVRRHPGSGRDALFVNPTYTARFEDMSAEESAPVLEYLYAHATRPENCCRFRWRAGSVAIWDNRATLHLAINDYDGFRRLMHRTTIEGEAPARAAGLTTPSEAEIPTPLRVQPTGSPAPAPESE